MRNKKYLLLLNAFLLVSCQANKQTYTIDDYQQSLSWNNETFNIMQLTDIHWTYVTKLAESKKYMQDLFDDAKAQQGHIDLVTITGDVFLNANKYIVEDLFSFFSSWDVPIAIVYGNHDKEGEWSLSWMNKMVSTSKNFIAKTLDDGMSGNTNYFIDLKSGNETLWQIYMMDSNSLAPSGNPIKYTYDRIQDDQVEWMKKIADTSKKGDAYLPSLGFIHIPPKEFGTSVEEAKKNSNALLGEQNEKSCPAKDDSPFFKTAKDINMKGIFFGHDHANDIVTKYDDVVLGYGVKSNIELYYYKDNTGFTHTGYALYSLKKDSSWTIQHVYMNYTKHSEIRRSEIWSSSL